VVLHVSLKVEVGELVAISEVEKLLKLGVGKNNATVVLVLKGVSTNVLVDLLTDLSACHLNAVLLSKELSKILGDASRLDETRRLTVRVRLALLGVLLKGLHLTIDDLIKELEILLEGSDNTSELLDLSTKLLKLGDRLKNSNLRDSGRRSDNVLNGGSNYLRGRGGLLLRSSLLIGSRSRSRSSLSGGSLRNTGHLV